MGATVRFASTFGAQSHMGATVRLGAQVRTRKNGRRGSVRS
jgi:hypothetical protein